jgi:ParB family transcriptional regulator, chromosome partitioning protein
MSVTTMTIDALCVSPFNCRTNEVDANNVAGLAKSLLTRGQIHPLSVHPIKGGRGKKRQWGAITGGRRLRAFRTLIDQGLLPADHPIDVNVLDISDEGELRELSLAENLPVLNLRAYEVYAAVAQAHAGGRSLKDIAETNGQTIETVRQWLRLGNLHPTIFAALEKGEIGKTHAFAFGATEDVALQLHVFEQIARYDANDWRRGPAEIRKLLKVGDRELEKMLRFVGEEAYHAAGGRYELDLFADDAEQRGIVTDAGLLMQLAEEKLDAIRARIRRQTGREIRFETQPPQLTISGYNQGEDRSLEIIAEAQPADAADAQWIAHVRYEMALHEARAEAALVDEDLSDEIRAHIIAAIDEVYEPLENELAYLEDRMTIDLPAGQIFATLIVDADANAQLRFWWADRKAKAKAEAAARKLPDAPAPRPVSAGPIGAATADADAPRPIVQPGAAINTGAGYDQRAKADALIRDEQGLTADGVQIMRSIRRETLRAALLADAHDEGNIFGTSVALDYLLWSLLRDRVTNAEMASTRSEDRGLLGFAYVHAPIVVGTVDHLERTQAHRIWRAAIDRLKAHPAIAEKDLVQAFDAFRAEGWGWKQEVAALVAGCALVRSANAAGYEVELHDHVALLTGLHDSELLRTLVEPTEELLDLLPKAKQLELVHPHVSNGEYLALEKLKAADLVGPVTRALKKAAGWVHPMLQFRPRLAAIATHERELEAAE